MDFPTNEVPMRLFGASELRIHYVKRSQAAVIWTDIIKYMD